MNSDDDMPLDSLIESHVTPEKNGNSVQKNLKCLSNETLMDKIKISETQYVIRKQKIEPNDLDEKTNNIIKELIHYDTSKYEIDLFTSLYIKLTPKSHNTVEDNKENEPENLTNGKEPDVESSDDDHEHNGNDFEIEDIGTYEDPPEKEDEAIDEKESSDEEVEIVKDTSQEAFWFLENGIVNSTKEVPPQFRNEDGSGPKLDCSVGGLYYKIYAESHERRMAASIVIKPAHIVHRKLYLQEENRNYPDTVSFMAAVKDTYLEKMLNGNPTLSIQTFCNQCYRCFTTPYDLQVHKELVHQTQHAATCRICEFNFSEPSLLLKHMAAVHSMESPPHGLLGAYRCMICRFMSPLYTELTRHYNEYHSRSGWLLCPLCLRVFSNDTTYEHHMNTHITKGRFFRCQSCRLVFESENFRTRHEQEMHYATRQTKWVQPDFNPKVPTHVKAWVRGDADNRSRIYNIDDLDQNLACRAICLNDCTDPDSILKSTQKKRPRAEMKPITEVIAPKAFQAEILVGKTRRGRIKQINNDIIEKKEDAITRDNPMINEMSELLYLLQTCDSDEEDICESETELKPEPETIPQLLEEKKLSEGEAGSDTDPEVEDEIPLNICHECGTHLTTKEQLFYHFSEFPLKSHKSSFESHCPIRYMNHRKTYLNGPSLETSRVKKEWLSIGKELLKSYPHGIKCSCGKSDWDFGNPNIIARHLIFNPKHTLQIMESEGHKDEVRNRILSQRIKRLIQTGQYVPLTQENLEPVLKSLPLTLQKPEPECRKRFSSGHELTEFAEMFPVTDRKLRKLGECKCIEDSEPRNKLGMSASGIDLEEKTILRKADICKISKKEQRLMTSVLHKANVERQSRLKQQNIQQQQQQQSFQTMHQQLLQQSLQQHPNHKQLQQLQNTGRFNINMHTNNVTSNRSQSGVNLSRDLHAGQKRSGSVVPSTAAKQNSRQGHTGRHTRPPQAKDVKFPVVSHKEIQVEIVPSDSAKKNTDIEFYEIEFKGRKTPNKYNVKPNIKIVKLIGLQSDTCYLIKVFAVRNSIRSDPVVRQVKTTPLPRGNTAAIVSDVIELD